MGNGLGGRCPDPAEEMLGQSAVGVASGRTVGQLLRLRGAGVCRSAAPPGKPAVPAQANPPSVSSFRTGWHALLYSATPKEGGGGPVPRGVYPAGGLR